MRIPEARKRVRAPLNCVRNAALVTAMRSRSAIGKQIEKKVESASPLKWGSTGFIRKAAARALSPSPIIEASITSRKDNFFLFPTMRGSPISANG
jgi:hypothetical protein